MSFVSRTLLLSFLSAEVGRLIQRTGLRGGIWQQDLAAGRVRNLLAAWVGWFVPPQSKSVLDIRNALQSGKIRQLLLVRPQLGLGDLLLFTPAIRAFHDQYPHVRIHVLASPRNKKALEGNPCIHKIWVLQESPVRSPLRFIRFIAALRRENFDLAIPVFTHTPSWTSFFIGRFVGSETVLSFDSTSFYNGTNWSKHFAHTVIAPVDASLPEWRRYAGHLEPLMKSMQNPRTEYHPAPQGLVWADDMWSRMAFGSNRPVVGLFLGGNPAHPKRFVPVSVWVQLAQRVQNEGAQLVLVYPPHEASLYKAFIAEFPTPLPVVDEFDLGRVIPFLKKLNLFICPDGGTFHLAAAYGVQTLGLFLSTDAQRWCPPGDHVRAIQLSQDGANLLPLDSLIP